MTPIDRTSDGAPRPPAETARDEGDGFLARWSRRKRDVARAETAPPIVEPEPAPPADAETGGAEPETLSEEELAALPSVDDLTETSDLAPFLRRGVPTSLKNAAMRKVWMLTPAIRDYRDPAVDYAWDWNTPGGVPGDGCAPSVEETARMLRDLMAPRDKQEETSTRNPRIETATQEDDGEPVEVVEADGMKPHGVETATESAPAPGHERMPPLAPGPRDFDPPETSPVSTTVRKRHGGAIPI